MWSYNHTPDPDELFHFGVKGMKWGVRKDRTKAYGFTRRQGKAVTKYVKAELKSAEKPTTRNKRKAERAAAKVKKVKAREDAKAERKDEKVKKKLREDLVKEKYKEQMSGKLESDLKREGITYTGDIKVLARKRADSEARKTTLSNPEQWYTKSKAEQIRKNFSDVYAKEAKQYGYKMKDVSKMSPAQMEEEARRQRKKYFQKEFPMTWQAYQGVYF